jgi:hypothetical protein
MPELLYMRIRPFANAFQFSVRLVSPVMIALWSRESCLSLRLRLCSAT